jgi:type III restriction enzyme
MAVIYDPALVETVAHGLDLRTPNIAALDALARQLDTAEYGTEMVADLATGVGKTYIAGGLLDYLAASGVRNVVIITPGSTIQRKTVNNLTPGNQKYLRGLRCNPLVVTLDDLERGTVAASLEDDTRFKVFVFTVQSLLRPNTADARRAHRPHETLGVALYEYLQAAGDLVVIADEHHVYYSGNAKKFQSALDDLRPMALIGLTATPHESSESKIVYRYPLAEAIADGYVKIPVLVARQDGMRDLRTQMADGVALLDAKEAAMNAYCAQVKKIPVKPILFVVAQTIDEATDLKGMLSAPDMLGGDDKVLLVTSEEPDKTLALLDTLEYPFSPIRAVVSVSMLKEGWDVKNIYVIAAVRAMESQLLTEQILGRGLRLPFGARTGVPMLDTVEVLSHHAFADLLKHAKVLLEQTLGQRAAEATAVVNPVPGRTVPGVEVSDELADTTVDGQSPTEVVVSLPGSTPAGSNGEGAQPFLFEAGEDLAGDRVEGGDQRHVGMGFATVESRVAAAQQARDTLTTVLTPRSPGGVKIPLFLPKVTTRWEREAFSLTQVNAVDVEALGRIFADDEGETLTRKALDATRNASGMVEIVIQDEHDIVLASQARLPFDTIESDLAGRLLNTNGVAATMAEMNGAIAVAQAFLRGAAVSPDTPWRAEHGRLATARLVEWISAQQKARPAREVTDITQVRWPDPGDRVEAQPPANRHVITSSKDFTRGYPYKGWVRSVYEVNSFDAYSTEFRLAGLFDTSPGLKAWIRVNQTVPLRITYLQGAIQREYEPDFIVIDEAGTHWIVEGKSDGEMNNPVVASKADAAHAWVSAVNASASVAQKWSYMLASEMVIASASSWSALKSGARTFG